MIMHKVSSSSEIPHSYTSYISCQDYLAKIFLTHFSFVSCTLIQFSPAGPLSYLYLKTVIENGFGESGLEYLGHSSDAVHLDYVRAL